MLRSVLKAWLLLGLAGGSADVAFRWPDVMATSFADIVLVCLAVAACAAILRKLRQHRPLPQARPHWSGLPGDRHSRR